jgi:hypothetical protein
VRECTSTVRGGKCGERIRDGDFFFLDPETGAIRCRVCTKVWLENNFRKMKGFVPKTEKDVVVLTYYTKIYAVCACKGDEQKALEEVTRMMGLPPPSKVKEGREDGNLV